MSEVETWKSIYSFPDYSVSNHGRVLKETTGRILSVCTNTHGIRYVGMTRGKRQYRRALGLLVASHYLDIPEEPYDTPTHMNGDRADCRAVNLMWRPRWFTNKYHAQFSGQEPMSFSVPVVCEETGEVFVNSMAAAVKYGVLDRAIRVAYLNRQPVWPTSFHIRPLN